MCPFFPLSRYMNMIIIIIIVWICSGLIEKEKSWNRTTDKLKCACTRYKFQRSWNRVCVFCVVILNNNYCSICFTNWSITLEDEIGCDVALNSFDLMPATIHYDSTGPHINEDYNNKMMPTKWCFTGIFRVYKFYFANQEISVHSLICLIWHI